VPALANPELRLVGRQPEREQCVLEDLEVRGDGRPRRPSVARDPGHVHDLGVVERRDREETGEAGQVAHQGLGLYLFPQVELSVGGESLAAVGSHPDHGQRAKAKRVVEVEVLAQLFGQEWMKLTTHGTAGEEVGPGGLEPAGAGAAENEAQVPLLDVAMHLVQQGRQPLYLVQHDERAWSEAPQLPGEAARVGEVGLEQCLVQQVDPIGVGEHGAQPCALAHAPRPEEEERAPRRGQNPGVLTGGHYAVILP